MGILIRTSDLPSRGRQDAWREIVCDTLGPLDMRMDPDVPLQGEIEAGQVGAVRVGRVQTTTPERIEQTAVLPEDS